jgi:CRP-like cAMP-binding protein
MDMAEYRKLPLFAGVSDDQITHLANHLYPKTFRPNTYIITAEQPSETLYIILRGTVKIHLQHSSGRDVIFGIRGPGEVIGEMGLAEGHRRSADVITL